MTLSRRIARLENAVSGGDGRVLIFMRVFVGRADGELTTTLRTALIVRSSPAESERLVRLPDEDVFRERVMAAADAAGEEKRGSAPSG